MPTYFDPIVLDDTDIQPGEHGTLMYLVQITSDAHDPLKNTYSIKGFDARDIRVRALKRDPHTNAETIWVINADILLENEHDELKRSLIFPNNELTKRALSLAEVILCLKYNPTERSPVRFNVITMHDERCTLGVLRQSLIEISDKTKTSLDELEALSYPMQHLLVSNIRRVISVFMWFKISPLDWGKDSYEKAKTLLECGSPTHWFLDSHYSETVLTDLLSMPHAHLYGIFVTHANEYNIFLNKVRFPIKWLFALEPEKHNALLKLALNFHNSQDFYTTQQHFQTEKLQGLIERLPLDALSDVAAIFSKTDEIFRMEKFIPLGQLFALPVDERNMLLSNVFALEQLDREELLDGACKLNLTALLDFFRPFLPMLFSKIDFLTYNIDILKMFVGQGVQLSSLRKLLSEDGNFDALLAFAENHSHIKFGTGMTALCDVSPDIRLAVIKNSNNARRLFIQGYSFKDIVLMDMELRHRLACHAQEKAWLIIIAKISINDISFLPEPVMTDLFNYLKEIGQPLYDEGFGKDLFAFLGQPTLAELCYISKKHKQLMSSIPEITLNEMEPETKSELAIHCMIISHLIRKSHISIMSLLLFDGYIRFFLYASFALVSTLVNEGGLRIEKLPILLTIDNEVRSQLTQAKNLEMLRNGEMAIEQFAPSEVTKSSLELLLDFKSHDTKNNQADSSKTTITRSRSYGSFFDEKPNSRVFKENRDIQSKGSVCLL